jgi:hypothetical protein
MTGRALAFTSTLFLVALCAYGAPSCNSTATVVTFSGYNGTPTFSIISPLPGECIAAPNASSLSIPVTIDVGGTFYLRPPGTACADTYNCGFAQLYVNNILNNAAGSATVDANLTSSTGAGIEGTYTLTVQLVVDVDDGGGTDIFSTGADASTAAADAGSVPPNGLYTTSVTITVAASCWDGGSGDAGPSDAGGGGGAGGA